MIDFSSEEKQFLSVESFKDLVSTPYKGEMNAVCWSRELIGDFSEIVATLELEENLLVLEPEHLRELQLSEQGKLAREILLNDFMALKDHGASPTLNLIKCYDRDDSYPFFSTDVYSFHVDRSPLPTDTFLCTYHGDSSEILPISQAVQKVLVPEIRDELKKLYGAGDEGFEAFLSEYFFDLHYKAIPEARPVSLGFGNLWKLAVDHPNSQVPPCVHRAPNELSGETRLMMIC